MEVHDFGSAGVELACGVRTCQHVINVRRPARTIVLRRLWIVILSHHIRATRQAFVLITNPITVRVIEANAVAIDDAIAEGAAAVIIRRLCVEVASRFVGAADHAASFVGRTWGRVGVAAVALCVEALREVGNGRAAFDNQHVALWICEHHEVTPARQTAVEASRCVFVAQPVATGLDEHRPEGQVRQLYVVIKLETRQQAILSSTVVDLDVVRRVTAGVRLADVNHTELTWRKRESTNSGEGVNARICMGVLGQDGPGVLACKPIRRTRRDCRQTHQNIVLGVSGGKVELSARIRSNHPNHIHDKPIRIEKRHSIVPIPIDSRGVCDVCNLQNGRFSRTVGSQENITCSNNESAQVKHPCGHSTSIAVQRQCEAVQSHLSLGRVVNLNVLVETRALRILGEEQATFLRLQKSRNAQGTETHEHFAR